MSTEPHQPVAHFEVLPFPRALEQAAQLPEPVRLTVSASPRQAPENTIECAAALTQLGHTVTPHLAARMVRDRAHLDALLAMTEEAGIEQLFVIGGDSTSPVGEFSSAGELLPLIRERPHGVHTIGIAGYPEGHPLIDQETLAAALQQKAELADYITNQMCFDPGALIRWIDQVRDRGIQLPVVIGMPGVVDRRRLLEVSMRIGVGPSLSFVRKQRGLRHLLRRASHTVEDLFDALAPSLADARLNILGFHYYTFNQLLDTWSWERHKHKAVKEATNELSQC